ncbi:MAG: hypothetical protein U0236_21320 [Nitrospira sp.]
MPYFGNDFSVGSLEGLNGPEYYGPVGRHYSLGQAAANRFDNDFVTTLGRMLQFVKPGGSIPVALTSISPGPLKPKITVFPPPSGDLNSPLQRFVADLNMWQGTGKVGNPTVDIVHYSNNEPYSWDPRNPDINSVDKWKAYRAQQLYNIMSAIVSPTPAEAVDLNYLIGDLDAYRPFLSGVYYATWKPDTVRVWTPPSGANNVPMFGSVRFLTAFGPLPKSIHPVVFESNIQNGTLVSAYRPLMGAGRLFNVFNNYPWGASAEWLKQAFVEVVGDDFVRNLAASVYSSNLDDYSIKDILGRVITDKWEAIVSNATAALQKEGRKQQKRDLVRSVAMIAIGAIALPAVGALFAPAAAAEGAAAGGATAAAAGTSPMAALVGAGMQLQMQKDKLDDAVNEAKNDKADDAAQAAADQQKADDQIRRDWDDWYAGKGGAALLAPYGITVDIWKSWSNDERLNHIKEINAGTFVPIPAQAPQQPSQPSQPTTPDQGTPSGPVEQMPTIESMVAGVSLSMAIQHGYTKESWEALSQKTRDDLIRQWTPVKQTVSVDSSGYEHAKPTSPVTPVQYDLVVEGHNVGSYSTVEAVSDAASKLTQPGDRFEILANGQSTGLRVRTATGIENIPADMAAQVKALPADTVKASVAKVDAAPSSGFPWWIIAVPAAAAAALVAHK